MEHTRIGRKCRQGQGRGERQLRLQVSDRGGRAFKALLKLIYPCPQGSYFKAGSTTRRLKSTVQAQNVEAERDQSERRNRDRREGDDVHSVGRAHRAIRVPHTRAGSRGRSLVCTEPGFDQLPDALVACAFPVRSQRERSHSLTKGCEFALALGAAPGQVRRYGTVLVGVEPVERPQWQQVFDLFVTHLG